MNQRFITIKLPAKRFSEAYDIDLVEQYRKVKDKDIIGEFFNRYMHLVFAVCMRYYKNEEQAKDSVMEIFEMLEEKLLKFTIINFKAWLYKVTRNHCLMQLRKKKRETELSEVELFLQADVENKIILHPEYEEDNSDKNLAGFLDQLKKSQRKCLEMMYFQNMSYKAIALETGYTLKQVKSHIQNGKRNLKILIKPEG
ncbi:hypothetical protein ES705_31575 [subsurface metagenome]